MKLLALTTALLVGISSAALAQGGGSGGGSSGGGAGGGASSSGTGTGASSSTSSTSGTSPSGTVTPNQREAIQNGVNNAIAIDPTIAPLGTNNTGTPITSTNPALGNTPTATNTPGTNNIPGGMNPDGTAAATPTNPRSVTDGSRFQGTPTNPELNRATTPLPHTPGNGTSGR